MKTHNQIILDEKDIARFWNYVKKESNDECWGWKAGKNEKGYGRISIKNKMYKVHRLSWFLHYGEIPTGLLVCHTCDNPGCINPSHLFLGTNKDNMHDMVEKGRSKGRSLHGENQVQHKLTEKQVIEIRKKYIPHIYSTRKLSAEFNVSQSVIHRIVTYRKWREV